MPPRFIERINHKTATLNTIFSDDDNPRPQSYLSSQSSFTAASQHLSRTSSQSQKTVLTPPPRYATPVQKSASPKQEQSGSEKWTLPKDSLILVTGANSFLGSHIVDRLLHHGYRVRGTVRDGEKAAWTSKFFESKYGPDRYSISIVGDMSLAGAFEEAIKGCAGVVHVASVTTMSADPNEVVLPSIAGALNVLDAAATEPSVKRFVYTSSVAAAKSQDRSQQSKVDSESWNVEDLNAAWKDPPYEEDRAFAVAASSKMQTEAVVWHWLACRKPGFVINTVLPDTLFGQILSPQHQDHPLSTMVLKAVFDGEPMYCPPCHFIDVQDAAVLHVAALLLPDVKDQRIFAKARPWNMKSLVQAVKKAYPDRTVGGDGRDFSEDQTAFTEAGQAEALLKRMGGRGWTDFETSIERNCEAFE